MSEVSDIPKGPYCYDDSRTCSFYREDPRIKSDLTGNGYVGSAWCDNLGVNSAQLDFEGVYEDDGSKCFTAYLLYDMCKICGGGE